MGIRASLLDVLFPPRCVFCRHVLKSGETDVCAKCAPLLPRASGSRASKKGEFFDKCVSPFYYKGLVRQSILRFKFGGKTGYAGSYAKFLAKTVSDELCGEYDLITWVPISAKREKKRGYDQSMLLAMATALELGTVAVSALSKDVDVPAQSGLGSGEKRRANVSGVYSVPDRELVAGRKILLIDDIVTTGATLSECARTLLMAGAADVVCAALARTE